MDGDDIWEDYSSEFMFPSEDEPCTCPVGNDGYPIHDATQHDYSSCTVEDCDCEAHWEHT
jgi:hypothetical protein